MSSKPEDTAYTIALDKRKQQITALQQEDDDVQAGHVRAAANLRAQKDYTPRGLQDKEDKELAAQDKTLVALIRQHAKRLDLTIEGYDEELEMKERRGRSELIHPIFVQAQRKKQLVPFFEQLEALQQETRKFNQPSQNVLQTQGEALHRKLTRIADQYLRGDMTQPQFVRQCNAELSKARWSQLAGWPRAGEIIKNLLFFIGTLGTLYTASAIYNKRFFPWNDNVENAGKQINGLQGAVKKVSPVLPELDAAEEGEALKAEHLTVTYNN